jgi:transposase-like protein
VPTVVNADATTPNGSLIDEIVREGARRMLAAALEAEVYSHLAEVAEQRDEHGRRLSVRNGFHAERTLSTSAGAVQFKAPRVNDRRVDPESGERKRFSSAILPPWARNTPKISEVLPATREQRCWAHKTANVLDSVPKSVKPAAMAAIAEIYNAKDEDRAAAAIRSFERQHGAKFLKTVKKITEDEDVLPAYFDSPAEHWIHLRPTNPIESTFSTVRLRTKVTRGAGPRTAALAMTFKLIESAQAR